MTGRQRESAVSAAAVAQTDPLRRPGFDAKDVVLLAHCLEDAGLVVRAPDPRDRGSWAGGETVERCATPAGRADAEPPAPLSEAEGRRRTELLTRVHEGWPSRPRER
ncbi:hypothetical protein [Streptomyces sp. NPDC046859]|uniref:hypothetical protein n=1 Tax=Streptomyces sp. NPDC046859 TaxID=3155734 RepID=UPI00340D556A